MIKKHMRIATLNARSILKVASPNTQKSFTKYLRSKLLNIDILCLQEVAHIRSHHANQHLTEEQQQRLEYIFPNCATIFSQHCAIIILNHQYSFLNETITRDERCISTSIVNAENKRLYKIVTVYAPSQHHARVPFLNSLLQLPFWSDTSTPLILLGDLNIHLYDQVTLAEKPFCDWLQQNYNDSFSLAENQNGLPTFSRNGHNTTIDYIFCDPSLKTHVTNCRHHVLPKSWTDHSMLSADIMSPSNHVGPGTWRFNPTLLDDDEFVQLLTKSLDTFFDRAYDPLLNPATNWDQVKEIIKLTALNYTQFRQRHRRSRMQQLERMREYLGPGPHLESIDSELEALIETETQQLILRTATRWHANGERNNKYFFRVLKQRQQQVTITALRDPTTGRTFSSTAEVLGHSRGFYESLFTPEDIDHQALKSILTAIPPTCCLSGPEANNLIDTIDIDTIEHLINKTPMGKSPGMDGIPFELYEKLIATHPKSIVLLTETMNEAMKGQIPNSWMKTRMTLLFKKGDATRLSNWRPLSLINTDAKLFTKLIANRLRNCLPKLITEYQTGFITDRLISDNGWVLGAAMSHLRLNDPDTPAIAVMIDQEKAYDRVHPLYLSKVLQKFGFPTQLVETIDQLFYQTQVSLSINGWLSQPFQQRRGLRQGDPLSPLLFNLAIEPFLRKVLQNPSLPGIPWRETLRDERQHKEYRNDICPSLPEMKVLAYADDVIVFLQDTTEWETLMHIYQQYSKASNARINLQKTASLSLSGKRHPAWHRLSLENQITWYDENSSQAVIYLGYPLYSTQIQLDNFLDTVYQKIVKHVGMLKSRSLSIKGKALVANSLILARLWHLLRVISPPQAWIDKCRRLIVSYVMPFFPRPPWLDLCRPPDQGGVGLLDITLQCKALQMIHIQRTCRKKEHGFLPRVFNYLVHFYTGQPHILTVMMSAKQFLPMFGSFPQLRSIWPQLISFPEIPICYEWRRYLLHAPLRKATIPADPTVIPIKLSIEFLVSDFFEWQRHDDSLRYVPAYYQPGGPLGRLMKGIDKGHWRWHEAIRQATEGGQPPAVKQDLEDILKPWTLNLGPNKAVPIVKADAQSIRRYLCRQSTKTIDDRQGVPLIV